MKKLLLLSVMAMAAAAGTHAATPEKMYLVGNFNNWICPTDETETYTLTDEDGDGVYTGSFEFTADQSPEFKIFTRPATWQSPDAYYGITTNSSTPLYNNQRWFRELTAGYDGYNISITNWEGGTLSVSATVTENADETLNVALELSCPTQPDAPKRAEQLYVIGDFNGWAIPTDSDSKGALVITHSTDEAYPEMYNADVTLPVNCNEFTIYDPANELFLSTGMVPISFYKPTPVNMGIMDYAYTNVDKLSDAGTFKIANGAGQTISITVSTDVSWGFIRLLSTSTTPVYQSPATDETMYLVYSIDDAEPVIQPALFSYTANFFRLGVDLNGKKIKFFWTNEASTTPAPENIWGATTADVINVSEGLDEVRQFVRGGHPYNYEFDESGTVVCSSDWVYSYASISTRPAESITSAHVYLIGTPQGWDINDGSMELENMGDGTYHGEFKIAAGDELVFRFYTALGNWDSGSLGSQIDDTAVTIMMPMNTWDTYNVVANGKGSWNLGANPDICLNLTVDLNHNTVMMNATETDSVEAITADDTEAPAEYYNLQGIRVSDPTPGSMYIMRRGDKATKVRL